MTQTVPKIEDSVATFRVRPEPFFCWPAPAASFWQAKKSSTTLVEEGYIFNRQLTDLGDSGKENDVEDIP